jgi:hypothetical protein
MKKTLFVVILMSLMLVFFNGPASASQATATSALNLSSILNMSELNVTWSADVTPAGANFAVAAAVLPGSPVYLNSTPTMSGGYYVAATIPSTTPYSAIATSQINYNSSPLTLALGATAKSGENGSDTPSAIGSADVLLAYTYNGLATKEFTISVPYVLSLNLLSTAGFPLGTSTAYGFSSIDFYMEVNGSKVEDHELYKSTVKRNGQFLNTSNTIGTYEFNVTLNPHDTGVLNFRTYATTSATQPVPIPGAVWLLGTGLVGLVGIRRRQRS